MRGAACRDRWRTRARPARSVLARPPAPRGPVLPSRRRRREGPSGRRPRSSDASALGWNRRAQPGAGDGRGRCPRSGAREARRGADRYRGRRRRDRRKRHPVRFGADRRARARAGPREWHPCVRAGSPCRRSLARAEGQRPRPGSPRGGPGERRPPVSCGEERARYERFPVPCPRPRSRQSPRRRPRCAGRQACARRGAEVCGDECSRSIPRTSTVQGGHVRLATVLDRAARSSESRTRPASPCWALARRRYRSRASLP